MTDREPGGRIDLIDIEQEVKTSFLEYAMSVIVSRALPDVRDGLKPVHRRILFSMYDTGIRPGTPFRKSARVVGDVMGWFHPHGGEAIYDAMVRLGQDFASRYPWSSRRATSARSTTRRRRCATRRRVSRNWRCIYSTVSTRTPSTSRTTTRGSARSRPCFPHGSPISS